MKRTNLGRHRFGWLEDGQRCIRLRAVGCEAVSPADPRPAITDFGEDVETENGSKTLVSEKFPKGKYTDVLGLCKVATLTEIEAQGWSLNPGRYVGVAERAADDFEFAVRLEELNEELETLNVEARELEERIAENVQSLLEGASGGA